MEFEAFTIAAVGDRDEPFAYPITDEQSSIIEELWDHGLQNVLTSNMFAVSKKNQYQNQWQFQMSNEMQTSFYVTDSRVAFLCEHFDNGNSYTGQGALIAEAISRAKAHKRTKGKVFLGQIRYEWLRTIGYKRKVSYGTKDIVSLRYIDTDKNSFALDFFFKKGTDTEFIANDILRRACIYRLAMTDNEEKEKQEGSVAFFEKYSTGGKITPTDNPKEDFSLISIPFSYYAPGGKKFRPGTQKQESEA